MTYAWFEIDGRQVFRKLPAPRGPRSGLPAPFIASDTMDLTEHVDGKHYDSKSAFRATTKALGYVEMGNDPQRLKPFKRPTPDRQGIRDSLKRAEARART